MGDTVLAFLQENLANIIVGSIVVFVLVLAVRHLVKNKRSLNCSCGDCGSCASSGVCSIHKQEQNQKAAENIHIKKRK